MSAFGGKADMTLTNVCSHPPWREGRDLPKIEHGREPALGGEMQGRGASEQPVKGQRRLGSKARKATTARVSAANLQEKLD